VHGPPTSIFFAEQPTASQAEMTIKPKARSHDADISRLPFAQPEERAPRSYHNCRDVSSHGFPCVKVVCGWPVARICRSRQAHQQASCQRDSHRNVRISGAILVAAHLLLHFKYKPRGNVCTRSATPNIWPSGVRTLGSSTPQWDSAVDGMLARNDPELRA
jgi:hypothetical protein